MKGRKTVDIFRYNETKDSVDLFPTGDLPTDASRDDFLIYSGVFSARKIFEIVSEATAQKIAPTVVQFALRGRSLEAEQPLLATLEEKEAMVHYDEGLMGAGNRMQTIIDGDENVHFDNEFNLVLMEEGEEYVFPIDIISSAENIQVPVKKPAISKQPRPKKEQNKPLSFESDKLVSFDTGFVASWARGDKYPKFSHSMGLIFELGEGDYGETAFLASLGSNRTKPAGHVWATVVRGLTDKEINNQDPQRYASGGMLSDEGIINRAGTLKNPFAVTMANSPYMVEKREERKALLNTKTI